ncbi:hypothetical protein FRC11_005992 [Ceratobasidium sp. 423]|nr:hypothetical protein FRC11_005992 [Ceratobasidium sp. 423]
MDVAAYVDRVALLIEAMNNILTETITTHSKRESNYVHHGWSVGTIGTFSPWTSSRTGTANHPDMGGTWITRRTLAQRLRVRVLLEDLTPVPEFEAAIEEALTHPTTVTFEKFQAVYRALGCWLVQSRGNVTKRLTELWEFDRGNVVALVNIIIDLPIRRITSGSD